MQIVLADANVLYSRVFRDYLLYAADAEIISIRWSEQILHEVIEHLIANRVDFDAAAGQRLVTAMTTAFPRASVDVNETARGQVAPLPLPDEDDRHVLAAAVAAQADILCTQNVKDFPAEVMQTIGARLVTVDDLLALLIAEHGDEMSDVHRNVVEHLPHASHESTLDALVRGGAPTAASLMRSMLDR